MADVNPILVVAAIPVAFSLLACAVIVVMATHEEWKEQQEKKDP